MIDKKRFLHDDNQFKFLQEGSSRILSRAQILLVLLSHELLSTLHVTYQSTYFIYSFNQIESKVERISIIQQLHQSYQENKIELLGELYFKLKLHLNLNIKSDYQENKQFSTSLCYSHVNVIKFFPTSCHVRTVLILINKSYHDSKCKPKHEP